MKDKNVTRAEADIPMGIKVAKFGGSSLADATQFKKVKDIVLADPDRRFVVPSAPGKRFDGDSKVTDLLYECHKLAHTGRDYSDCFSRIVDRLCGIVSAIKAAHPDCAVTLSMGERTRESYQALFDAGADRYLLRHETASADHYARIHPAEMSFDNRMRCLSDLRSIGYAVGCGFMVGSPFQTPANLAADLKFIEQFRPEMCGIGPFVPHHATPFAGEPGGSVELTLLCLSLLRLINPGILIPATTALGTLDPRGRERGILAGANVVMPNLSPVGVRKKYELYDNKICTGEEAAECRDCLGARMLSIGYRVVVDRGDPRPAP